MVGAIVYVRILILQRHVSVMKKKVVNWIYHIVNGSSIYRCKQDYLNATV